MSVSVSRRCVADARLYTAYPGRRTLKVLVEEACVQHQPERSGALFIWTYRHPRDGHNSWSTIIQCFIHEPPPPLVPRPPPARPPRSPRRAPPRTRASRALRPASHRRRAPRARPPRPRAQPPPRSPPAPHRGRSAGPRRLRLRGSTPSRDSILQAGPRVRDVRAAAYEQERGRLAAQRADRSVADLLQRSS